METINTSTSTVPTQPITAAVVPTENITAKLKRVLPSKEYTVGDFLHYSSKLDAVPMFASSGTGSTYAFTGGKHEVLNGITSQLRVNESIQESYASTLEALGSGRHTRDVERMINQESREFKKAAQGFVRVAHDSLKSHAHSIAALERDVLDAHKTMKTDHIKLLNDVRNASGSTQIGGEIFHLPDAETKNKLIAELDSRFHDGLAELNRFKAAQLDKHFDAINEIKEVTKNVAEKTGVDGSKVLGFELNKTVSTAAKEGGAMGRMVDSAVKEAEEVGKVSGGASLAIVGGTTALGAIAGHALLDRGEDAGHTGTIGGGIAGLVVGLAAKSKIAQWLNLASHARA